MSAYPSDLLKDLLVGGDIPLVDRCPGNFSSLVLITALGLYGVGARKESLRGKKRTPAGEYVRGGRGEAQGNILGNIDINNRKSRKRM